jgi:hypothetical protein
MRRVLSLDAAEKIGEEKRAGCEKLAAVLSS